MFSLPNFQIRCVGVLHLPKKKPPDFRALNVKHHKDEYVYATSNIFVNPLGLH